MQENPKPTSFSKVIQKMKAEGKLSEFMATVKKVCDDPYLKKKASQIAGESDQSSKDNDSSANVSEETKVVPTDIKE